MVTTCDQSDDAGLNAVTTLGIIRALWAKGEGWAMQCPACGAEMLLVQVVLDDTTRQAPAIERQVFKCAACPQVARRLLFSVPLASTNASSVATTHLKAGAIRLRVH
jgi:hypothetical protein